MTFGTSTFGSYVPGAGSTTDAVGGLPQFGGSGSLTSVSALLQVSTAPQFAGSGALASMVAPQVSSAPSMSGSGTLTATVGAVKPDSGSNVFGGYVLGAGGAAGSAPAPVVQQFSGTGALSGLAVLNALATPSLSSSGALTATTVARPAVLAGFSSSGELTMAVQSPSATPAFNGAGQVSCAASSAFSTPLSFAGAGQLTTATRAAVNVAAAFGADGSLTAVAQLATGAVAAFSASGVLALTSMATPAVTPSFAGAGQLAGLVGPVIHYVGLSGDGQLAAAQLARVIVMPQLSGAGQLSAAAMVIANSYLNPTLLAAPSGTITGTNVGAVAAAGEPALATGLPAYATVWYSFTAPSDGTLTVSLSTTTLALAVYDSAMLGQSFSSLTVPVLAGRTYTVRVASTSASATSPYTLTYSFVTVPNQVVATPTLRGSSFSSGTATSVTMAKPADLTVGDTMLLYLAITDAGGAFPPELAGWDGNQGYSSTVDWNARLYRRVATAADVAGSSIAITIATVATEYLATLITTVGTTYFRGPTFQLSPNASGELPMAGLSVAGDLQVAVLHLRGASTTTTTVGTRTTLLAESAATGLRSDVFTNAARGVTDYLDAVHPYVTLAGGYNALVAVNFQLRAYVAPVPNYDQAHATDLPVNVYEARTLDLSGTASTPPFREFLAYWKVTAGAVARHVRISTIGTSTTDRYRANTIVERYATDGLTELAYSDSVGNRSESLLEFDVAPGQTNIIGIGFYGLLLGVVRYELTVTGIATPVPTWVVIPTPAAARSSAKAFT